MPLRSRRRRPKTIPSQGLTGQQGINLVEHIVLDAGSRWTPSGANEVGIDGYIELFDSHSHEPLGLTLAVQSKVVNSICGSTSASFDYWCDPNDVEYWLHGNVPVILVVSCPSAREAYWALINERLKAWTRADAARITFIKSDDRFDRAAFPLLAKVAAPRSGLYLAPTRRREVLHTNLLSLESHPASIFIADTDFRAKGEIRTALRKSNADIGSVCVLWEKKIISFNDLNESPWSSMCDVGTCETFPASEWSTSEEPDRHRIFVQLLNQTLREQISLRVRYWPKEDCYAMAGRPRKVAYQSLKRTSRISVVSDFSTTTTDGRHFEWFRHLAFRGQFRLLGEHWYLEITPSYRFTRDGYELDRFHEDRLKGIKRIEGNRAVLSVVLFWSDQLRSKKNLFEDYQPPLRFGELLSFETDVGIVDANWLADDPDFRSDDGLGSERLLLPDIEEGISL